MDNMINYFSVEKGRIEYFDIAKGLGIIFVVWFHSKGPFASYLPQFIMPLFFLISGLLYSQRSEVKDYIIRKIHGLYLPFIIWNLLFLSINAFFQDYTFIDFLKKAILILLTLKKDGIFLGATWFLGSLFLISVLYKIIESSINESKYKDILLLIIFTIMAIIGFKVSLPYALSRTLILGFFYAVGAFIKKNKSIISNKISYELVYYILPIIGGIIFTIFASFNSVYLGTQVRITYPLLFVIGALCISYFIITLSKWMENSDNKLVSSIKKVIIVSGQHSIDIVIWHFVFFKIVIIIQMILNNEKISYSNLIAHHNIFSSSNGWWMVYLLVGVFVPLIWGYILRQGVWGRILKKIHAVN